MTHWGVEKAIAETRKDDGKTNIFLCFLHSPGGYALFQLVVVIDELP